MRKICVKSAWIRRANPLALLLSLLSFSFAFCANVREMCAKENRHQCLKLVFCGYHHNLVTSVYSWNPILASINANMAGIDNILIRRSSTLSRRRLYNWTSERDWPSQLCIYSIVNRHTYISHLELKIKLFSLWHVFAQNSFFSFMNIYFYIFILIVVILHIFTYNLEKLWFPVILSKFVKNHYSYL